MMSKKEEVFPLEISSIILPFYTQALIKLGINTDPITGKKEENLEIAKNFIDLIDFIYEKMKGNLTEDEEKFFENVLAQLKTEYLKKKNIIKL